MKDLSSFLQLGYFIDYESNALPVNVSRIEKTKYKDLGEDELIEIGVEIWRQAVSHYFSTNEDHVVPISGGLDSRAILAGLIEHTDVANIDTFTFGTEGALDYDIGLLIARTAGVRHVAYDLKDHIYTQAELEDVSKRVDHRTILFHHPPVNKILDKYAGHEVWCGFMGDPLAGSKLLENPSENIDIARKRFVEKNRYVKSVSVAEKVDVQRIKNTLGIPGKLLTYDEQLDFQIRQNQFIAPHVMMKGFRYKTPFLYEPWVEFMLSIDNKYRRDELLYKRILVKAFPVLFSMRTKTNDGLPLFASKVKMNLSRIAHRVVRTVKNDPNRYVNYLEFNTAIRNKPDLRVIIERNMLDLRSRRIIPATAISEILTKHMNGVGNFADILIVLASLEIHIKAGLEV